MRENFGVRLAAQRIKLLAGFLLLVSTLVQAQLPTGAISGRVADSTGAVIPGATVIVTNVETGRVQTTQTSAAGFYKVILPVGIYDVRVEAVSFRPEVRQGLRLAVAQEAVLNFGLSVGSVQETVTVTAEAPLVDTTSGSLGGLVNEERIAELPLNGRNFSDLALLQPGIAVHTPVSTTAPTSKGLQYSSNGAPIQSNYIMLDGANLVSLGGTSGVSASGSMLGVEGIREFKVITNFFPAEYGMAMGSQMTVVSKAGTNNFHGSLFEYLRNSALDARNFFDRKLHENDPRIPPFRRNNFGGSFGGPIQRDKTFFFVAYEGVRESLGLSQTLSTPTAAARQDGFFSGVNVNPNVKPYLDLFPLPTEPLPSDPTGASGVGRFTYVFKQPTVEDYGQGRWDYNFSTEDSLFVRYTIHDAARTRPTNFPQYGETYDSRGQFITLAENHIFSPTVMNTFRFSYSRAFESALLDFGGNSGDLSLGFYPGLQMGTIRPGSGIDRIGPSAGSPRSLNQNTYTLSNDVFWTRGTHSLKFGTLLNRFQTYAANNTRRRGEYTFSALRDFVAGNARQLSIMTPGSSAEASFRWSTYGFYIQDDWRLASNFTLNLGFRYEFRNDVNEVSGRNSSVIDVLHDAQATVPSKPFENNSLRNFSPRVGFAWDVFGDASTSVRGGFGLLYDVATFGWVAGSTLDNKPPFATRTDVSSNLTFPVSAIPPPNLVAPSIGMLDFHMQQPHLLQYNITVDRQLPGAMAASVSYVSSRGLNLYQLKEGNPVIPLSQLGGRDFWGASDKRINPNWSAIEYKTAGGDSWYNSMQLSVQKRLSHGIQFQSSYTWSHALDTTQGSNGSQAGGSDAIGLDPHHPSYDKGSADFDIRHSWAFNTLYDLPKTNLTGVGNTLLNGWRVGTILRVLSGQPFTPTLSGNRSRSQVKGSSALDRPDLIAGRSPDDIVLGGPNQYFDPTAFAIPEVGVLGTSARNLLQGPGGANVDISLAKEFPLPGLGEGDRLEFRTEVFNIFNRANFYIPIGGAVVYTADQTRQNTTPLSTAGTIDRTLGSARQIQFALKLIF